MANVRSRSILQSRSIAVIGKGNVGRSFAAELRERPQGFHLHSHLAARAKDFSILRKNGGPEVILIAAKDDEIAKVSAKAIANAGENLRLILHVAGSLSPNILAHQDSVARLTLHPAQTFPKADSALFQGISFMACSEEQGAINWAKKFTQALGARSLITLQEDQLPLYHAMLVFAANATVLLGKAIELLSEQLEQTPKKMKEVVRPLMRQAMNNVLTHSAEEVLTGPIRRGDAQTIRKHQQELKKVSPELRKLYDAFLLFAQAEDLSGLK